MAVTQVVIVDQTHQIDPTLLHNAAVALDSQVTQDLPQFWSGITANVSSAPALSAVPSGAWPVFLVRSLPPGEGGFHLDRHNQPYAKVIASPDDDSWTVDASLFRTGWRNWESRNRIDAGRRTRLTECTRSQDGGFV